MICIILNLLNDLIDIFWYWTLQLSTVNSIEKQSGKSKKLLNYQLFGKYAPSLKYRKLYWVVSIN